MTYNDNDRSKFNVMEVVHRINRDGGVIEGGGGIEEGGRGRRKRLHQLIGQSVTLHGSEKAN